MSLRREGGMMSSRVRMRVSIASRGTTLRNRCALLHTMYIRGWYSKGVHLFMSLLFVANILALFFSFFVVGVLLGALFSKPFREKIVELLRLRRLLLVKSLHNPILRPGTTPWTAEAVLNPAAAGPAGRPH